MTEFTLDESRLAHVAGRHEIETDHDALLALEAVILGDGDSDPLLAGPCEIAVDLLADADGELDGYRIILHPAADEAAPWLASGIQRASSHRDDGRDAAGIIRDFVRVANSLLAWHQEHRQATAPQPAPLVFAHPKPHRDLQPGDILVSHHEMRYLIEKTGTECGYDKWTAVRYTDRGKPVPSSARLLAEGTSTVLGFAGEAGQ
jgi:hypothetical protein